MEQEVPWIGLHFKIGGFHASGVSEEGDIATKTANARVKSSKRNEALPSETLRYFVNCKAPGVPPRDPVKITTL